MKHTYPPPQFCSRTPRSVQPRPLRLPVVRGLAARLGSILMVILLAQAAARSASADHRVSAVPASQMTMTPAAPPTATSAEVCTPRPDPLVFTVHIEPPHPQVGDEVRVTVGLSEVDGLLLGHALITLQGAAPLFGRDPQPFRQEGLLQGPVTFILHAQLGGTTELLVDVNYETECACGTVCYYRRTVVSPPFPLTVLGPIATPTVVCTPPLCGEGEVFACPDTCPGGCGTICATRTPTACPTPPCRNDETFFCPDACPGGCGLRCATRTQTPIPIPACRGDCNDDGRVDVSELVRGVRVALGAGSDRQCLIAFDSEGTGTPRVDDLVAAVNSALTGCGYITSDSRERTCRHSGGVISPFGAAASPDCREPTSSGSRRAPTTESRPTPAPSTARHVRVSPLDGSCFPADAAFTSVRSAGRRPDATPSHSSSGSRRSRGPCARIRQGVPSASGRRHPW